MNYEGQRILEAMRNAPRYADAVYEQVRSATPTKLGAVLDFGAGDGMFVEHFLRDGITVECVEPDPKNQVALRLHGVHVMDDIASIPDERYDFAYTINVLEHLDNVHYHLTQIRRVLRKEGVLFVFVPAFDALWTSLDSEVGHVQRFTRRTLNRYLTRAGFKVEKSRFFDSAGFVAAYAVRLLETAGMFNYSPTTVGFYDRMILPLSLAGDTLLSGVFGKNLIAIARKV